MSQAALLEAVTAIAREAGEAILAVYHRASPMDVQYKDDNSPLTEADLAAHRLIDSGLRALDPALPVLSEESAALPWAERAAWRRYWLVDPLDGTKEFIKRNGEFTVNIALIDDGVPVLGVVCVPALNICYYGGAGLGAFRRDGDGAARAIQTSPVREGDCLRVVASRSHRGGKLEQWMEVARRRFPELELVSMGSSLKICLVAEGRADVYPRLAPTSEWDTAAAQAVLEAAGGQLTDTRLQAYRYNRKADILNPHFYALGDRDYDWEQLLAPLGPS